MDPTGYADVNGLRMYYEMRGSGPTLLLLDFVLDMPESAIDFFAESYKVIAPDQMGHGRTADDPGRSFRFHDMAEDTVELLRQLDVDNAAVFGFSDGGIIALDLALHHPEMVTKLVLSGVYVRPDGLRRSTFDWIQSSDPDEWPKVIREPYDRLSPDGPGHWSAVLGRMKKLWRDEPNYGDENLAGLQAPTLVIAGDRDVIEHEHTLQLFRSLPTSQLCVVPGTGHGALPRTPIMRFLGDSEA